MSAIPIDEGDWSSRARLKCQDRGKHVDWTATDDGFFCKTCNRHYDALLDAKTDRLVRREDVRIIGRRWHRGRS